MLSHLASKGSAVVAFVSVEFEHPALGTNAQFVHSGFGSGYVVAVALEGHTRQWQAVLLGQERDVRPITVVLAVVADTGILWSLDECAVQVAEAQVDLAFMVEQDQDMLPTELQVAVLLPEAEPPPAGAVVAPTD